MREGGREHVNTYACIHSLLVVVRVFVERHLRSAKGPAFEGRQKNFPNSLQ